MIVGCYSLHLYCDVLPLHDPDHGFDEFTHEFGADCETGAQARRQARRAGWKINLRDGLATCPNCSKRGLIAYEAEG